MVKTSCIAIIPARGGSKRIPKKNIINFHSKPMLAWSIEAALKSELFEKVIVSTECEEIAQIAVDHGASVPFLRTQYIDDYSPISLVSIHVLNELKLQLNEEPSHVVQLMANCPLRDSEHIRNSYHSFIETHSEFQISCFKFGWMNPWWSARLDQNNTPRPLFPEALAQRSQDLPSLYCPSGAIWIAKTESLIAANSFYGPAHRYYPIPWWAAVDIDDEDDLEMATAIKYMLTTGEVSF